MSDPVTNVEIDDVLASIRRLVAGEGAARPQVAAADKLVLTPSLRVDEDPVEDEVEVSVHMGTAFDDDDTPTDRASELERKIAVLESMVAKSSEQWEPDVDGQDDYAGGPNVEALQWEDFSADAIAPVVMPAADPVVTVADVSDPDPSDDTDDVVLDEAVLRQIVHAAIEDELRGELGERITRVVRKMVRREIQLALASRELS